MRRNSRSRSSFGALLIIIAVTAALLVPTAIQAAPSGTYSASSSATLLNLQLLAATSQPTIKIATVKSENSSSPVSAKASATGLFCVGTGECETFINNSTQSASAPSDAAPGQKCHSGSPLPLGDLLSVNQACGDASAKTSTGDPVGQATAGATSVEARLDVGSLFPEAGTALTDIVDQTATLLAPVIDAAPADLKPVLNSLFDNIAGKRKILAVNIGEAKSSASSDGTTVSGLASTPILTFGVLPICDLNADLAEVCPTDLTTLSPLTHGLLKISISGGSAEAKYLGAESKGSSAASAANVTVEVRDLNAQGNLYEKVVDLAVPAQTLDLPLPNPLATTVKLGAVQKSDPGALPATASVSALEVHALKGFKQSATGPDPGGILFQVGVLDARADGKIPTSVLALPKTGGMRYVFFALAALLAVGAPAIYLISRRIRRAA